MPDSTHQPSDHQDTAAPIAVTTPAVLADPDTGLNNVSLAVPLFTRVDGRDVELATVTVDLPCGKDLLDATRLATIFRRAADHYRHEADLRAEQQRQTQARINDMFRHLDAMGATPRTDSAATDEATAQDADDSDSASPKPDHAETPEPRMEVLYLPETDGDTPFALVVTGATFADRAERNAYQYGLDAFAQRCGARAALISDVPVAV